MNRTQVIVIGVAGLAVTGILWGVLAMPGGKESGGRAVRLTADSRDVTIDEVKAQLERNPANTRKQQETGDNPVDIERMKQLIIKSEMPAEEPYEEKKTDTATYIYPTKENLERIAGEVMRKKAAPQKEKKKGSVKKDSTNIRQPVKDTGKRGFNSVRLVRQEERNVIRAFVHSTQTVMAGSTLKMQIAENCLTDDGRRIRKGTPVYGEVAKVDGERVLVKITGINVGGNILPFKREVYSQDAMEGIYVPGNAKAETAQDAEAAAVNGANTNISGGLDMGSQLVAGAANSVINATKSATGKNIKKVKVTIKTNYQILLMEDKKQ